MSISSVTLMLWSVLPNLENFEKKKTCSSANSGDDSEEKNFFNVSLQGLNGNIYVVDWKIADLAKEFDVNMSAKTKKFNHKFQKKIS